MASSYRKAPRSNALLGFVFRRQFPFFHRVNQVPKRHRKATKRCTHDEQVTPKQKEDEKQYTKAKGVNRRQAQAEPVFVLDLATHARRPSRIREHDEISDVAAMVCQLSANKHAPD